MEMQKNWYIAKLVFEIKDSSIPCAQFDEQWRMIHADSLQKAQAMAEHIGREESQTLHRNDGSSVNWAFMAVVDVFEFDTRNQGAQLFSRTEVAERPDLYLESVNARAKYLKGQLSNDTSTLVL